MKIAVISDVHGNWPALKSVLADAQNNNVDEMWFLGDYVGYGPFPNDVVKAVRQCASRLIVGNYDRNVLQRSYWDNPLKRRKNLSKYFSFQWTYRHLSSRNKIYLSRLPCRMVVRRAGTTFLCVHGSPTGIDDPLRVDTPLHRFRELARRCPYAIVLCGHTHVFFDKRVGGIRFINPGSVGRPFDGDPRASYIILEKKSSQFRVQNYRVRYNINTTLMRMKKERFPRDMIDSIAEGRMLEFIQDRNLTAQWNKDVLPGILALAVSCRYKKQHSHQVAKLALKMFDGLRALHHLGTQERLLLWSGALLHDIGWISGRKRHHKTGRDLILTAKNLPLGAEEQIVTALLIRYHRRSPPRPYHRYFSDLPAEGKNKVCILASLLRVADALDRRHVNAVQEISCRVGRQKVILHVYGTVLTEDEKVAARKKGDLFVNTFQKGLAVRCHPGKNLKS